GSPDVTVAAIAPIDRAGPGDLSFVAGVRYLPYLQRTRAGVVLCAEGLAAERGPEGTVLIIVPDPHAALLAVLPVLYPQAVWEPGIRPSAVIGRGTVWDDPVAIGPRVVLGEGVRLGRNVRLGAGCVIGDGVAIGEESELQAQVTCYAGVRIGRRVVVHSGARL